MEISLYSSRILGCLDTELWHVSEVIDILLRCEVEEFTLQRVQPLVIEQPVSAVSCMRPAFWTFRPEGYIAYVNVRQKI